MGLFTTRQSMTRLLVRLAENHRETAFSLIFFGDSITASIVSESAWV
jgi:hypothetical protein